MKRISLLVIALSLVLVPVSAFAQTGSSGSSFPTGSSGNSGPVYSSSQSTVQNPLGNINSFCGLIKALLTAIIAIGIPIAVLFIVYAGFKFVMAQGSPDALTKARNNLLTTLVGIGIFLGAWLLAEVIANTVNSLGAGSTQSQLISCQ